ncbi:MAG: hypothetical protein KTR27_03960 [Leptolyngbyaceae cyanobacterium MAG.088]|nr:hypothetical protein [Leptolyngbyaceae cyanobacterium MAG.088]
MKRFLALLMLATSLSVALSASAKPGQWANNPTEPKQQSTISLDDDVMPSIMADLPADGELSFGEQSVIAVLKLDNQSILRFVKLADDQIAVLEDAPRGAKSIDTVGLSPNSNIAEVFYAFSEPGTEIPAAILNNNEIPRQKSQGWARSLVNPSLPELLDQPLQVAQATSGNCNDNNFRNWFNNFSYNDRGTPDFRLNQVPAESNFFERYRETPGNGQSYRFYRYTVGGNDGSIWYNVDRYASRVAVCAIDSTESQNPYGMAHPPISYQGYENDHMGPVVRMMYRRPNESTWNVATVKDFAAGDVGSTLSWHFYTGANWDWRTDIYWAGGQDSFDIGHALADLGI